MCILRLGGIGMKQHRLAEKWELFKIVYHYYLFIYLFNINFKRPRLLTQLKLQLRPDKSYYILKRAIGTMQTFS